MPRTGTAILGDFLVALSPGLGPEAFITKGKKAARTAAQYPGRHLPGFVCFLLVM